MTYHSVQLFKLLFMNNSLYYRYVVSEPTISTAEVFYSAPASLCTSDAKWSSNWLRCFLLLSILLAFSLRIFDHRLKFQRHALLDILLQRFPQLRLQFSLPRCFLLFVLRRVLALQEGIKLITQFAHLLLMSSS